MMDTIKPGYIRVSTILDQWKAYDRVDKAKLKERADIGTKVHAMIDAHLNSVPFVGDDASDEEKLYFQSFLTWSDGVKPKFIASEQRFYHDGMGVTGCVDAIIRMPWCDTSIIVDWKTSSSAVKGIWDLQAAFYMLLALENRVEGLEDRALFIQLDREGGKPKIHEYVYDKIMREACLSAVNTYKFLKHKGFPLDKSG